MRNKIHIRFPKLKNDSYKDTARSNEITLTQRLEQLSMNKTPSAATPRPKPAFSKSGGSTRPKPKTFALV